MMERGHFLWEGDGWDGRGREGGEGERALFYVLKTLVTTCPSPLVYMPYYVCVLALLFHAMCYLPSSLPCYYMPTMLTTCSNGPPRRGQKLLPQVVHLLASHHIPWLASFLIILGVTFPDHGEAPPPLTCFFCHHPLSLPTCVMPTVLAVAASTPLCWLPI